MQTHRTPVRSEPQARRRLSSITSQVLTSFEQTPDTRLRFIMTTLVWHLHAFARDVKLSDAEWQSALDLLAAASESQEARRQELILLSDVLGLSSLLVQQNHRGASGATEATVLGPFYVAAAPALPYGADIAQGAPGVPCLVRGAVRGVSGALIAGAMLEVWQADAEGHYDIQVPGPATHRNRGVLRTDTAGRFEFHTVAAEAYPIPTAGLVGDLLRATQRSAWRPAHLHFKISADGYETLVTHIFRRRDPYLEADPVFAVRPSLVVDWQLQADGSFLVELDFVLSRRVSREESAA